MLNLELPSVDILYCICINQHNNNRLDHIVDHFDFGGIPENEAIKRTHVTMNRTRDLEFPKYFTTMLHRHPTMPKYMILS
jgi:hypothetical protein